MAAENRKYK